MLFMKKNHIALAISLLGTMVFQAMPVLASHQFPDVSTTNKYHTGIDYLVDSGVIQGYPDGTFKPNQEINRVEALKIFFGSFGLITSELPAPSPDETAGFSDTIAGQWYIRFVLHAKTTGVVQGYPDGSFRPTNQVNLVEALKMIFEIFDMPVLSEVNAETDLPNDVAASDWFAKYVAFALQTNIISENASGNVTPGKGLTRAALAEIAYRVKLMNNNHLPEFLPSKTISGPITGIDKENFRFTVRTEDEGPIIAVFLAGETPDPGLVQIFDTLTADTMMEITGWYDATAKTISPVTMSSVPGEGTGDTGEPPALPSSSGGTAINSPVEGIVSKVNISAKTFLLGLQTTFLTVSVPDSARWFEGMEQSSKTLATLEPGVNVRVEGTYSDTVKIFTASAITINNFSLVVPDAFYPIAIEDNAFASADATMYAYVDSDNPLRVRFTNLSDIPHQIAVDPHPTHTQEPGFVSGILQKGDTYEYPFTRAGTYTYHCHLHPNMKGTITVIVPQG